jgi:hypothetical protein
VSLASRIFGWLGSFFSDLRVFPRSNYPPLRIVRLSDAALAAGVEEEHGVEGVSVKVYCLLPLLPFLTQHQTGHRARFAMGHDVAQHPPGRDVILQP